MTAAFGPRRRKWPGVAVRSTSVTTPPRLCGLALLRAIVAVEEEERRAEGDDRTGLRMLRAALEGPTRQIAANSGVDGGVVIDRMRAGTGAYGYDAARGIYGDLLEAGIIDPTKVGLLSSFFV
jgi:chaperonin GroEL (HSP60 family)